MTNQIDPDKKLDAEQMNEEQESGSSKKWPREEDFIEQETKALEELGVEFAGNDDDDEGVASLEGPSIGGLEDKLTEMEKKVHDHWNDMMRARAELENVRQRADRDVSNARKFALEKFTVELLPIIDSIEHGLEINIEGDNVAAKVFEGMVLTRDLMLKTLEKHGVTQINPEGEPFDPSLHEAVSTQPAEGIDINTIVAVMQKGYMLHDRLIRPAMVVVAK